MGLADGQTKEINVCVFVCFEGVFLSVCVLSVCVCFKCVCVF